MFGVYKVTKSGKHVYVSRTCTENERLAREIAADLTRGEVVLPTGAIKQVKPAPHIHKRIEDQGK